MRRGVPFAEALRMSPARRVAFTVLFGEQDGGEFDWSAMAWKKQPGGAVS